MLSMLCSRVERFRVNKRFFNVLLVCVLFTQFFVVVVVVGFLLVKINKQVTTTKLEKTMKLKDDDKRYRATVNVCNFVRKRLFVVDTIVCAKECD